MKNRSKALTGAVLAVGLIVAGATSAQAFSGSRSVTLPGTNINLQANAWSQSVLSGGRADFATSSKATVNGSAKSVATQALQATVGYSAKSSVSVNINGATAGNLLGTGAPIDATFVGSAAVNNATPVYSANTVAGAAKTGDPAMRSRTATRPTAA